MKLAGMCVLGMVVGQAVPASAANLLTNGDLDLTHAEEIVPSFFQPKPSFWVNVGIKSVSGSYNDELTSESFAGTVPTPATTDGLLNPPSPDGCDGPDCGVFFKAFTGTAGDSATGHLYQDVAGSAGLTYLFTGWAGAESNYLSSQSLFALDFFNGLGVPIGSATLDLVGAGLFVPNGQPFNYKFYSLQAVAPAGTAVVRARISMIDGINNPAGGGQAFVVDDFTLSVADTVPEPGTVTLLAAGIVVAAWKRLRSQQDR